MAVIEVTEALIQEMVFVALECKPDAIILFGSYATVVPDLSPMSTMV